MKKTVGDIDMTEEKIIEEVNSFMSKHEILVSIKTEKTGRGARFTTFGSSAGCNAIYEIINSLNEEVKSMVIKMMQNKEI